MPDEKKLPWGINATKPGSAKTLTKTKLQAFSIGTHKKTPFQKHKEELELKKKQESEEAAKVYAEFVASFEKEEGAGKTFVKGETIVPKLLFDHEAINAKKEPTITTSAPKLYKPQAFVSVSKPIQPESKPEDSAEKIEKNEDEEKKDDKSKRKRNLDAFLEEIKREQEEREDRLRQKHAKLAGAGVSSEAGSDDFVPTSLTVKAAFEDRPGSHDTGDPNTTNLYVGNISPEVNEEMLCKEFAKYGPIASVKIMWPRTQEEKDRNRNCGFVSFMDRECAAQALKNMDGKELLGYVMRVGWGKAVPIPPKPIYVLNEGVRPPPSGLPFNAQMVHTKAYTNVPPPGTSTVAPKGPRLEVHVSRPENVQIVKIIHRMVERVVKFGPPFEAIIMDREWNNPKFSFLFQNDSLEHVYYRWRLYSILQGDPKNKWRTEPFHMFDEGPIWVPPEIPFDEDAADELLDSDEEDERERERIPKGTLGPKAKHRLEVMLRKLTFERGVIAKTMAFAIDHSDAADEIVEIICKTLMIKETPIPTKVARLYLVSDVLHNSSVSVPNAWKFRTGFESKLPEVFEHLNEVYRSITARLKAETFRRQVTTILTVWENWIVFPQPYIESLTNTFMKNTKEGDSLTYSSIPQSSTSSTSSIDGNANNLLDGVPMNMDIDSEASSKLNIGGILGVKTKWDNDEEEDNNHSDNIKKDGSPTSSINGSRGISEIEPTKSSETKDYGSEKMKLGNEEYNTNSETRFRKN
ncbi:U2 snRNP-associated SURP motif-containing protein-like [Rhizophagus irregularis DAOM 181602=DAOM 197198]|nr:U2 snRNP-associated SURP motif-containing protein-like [Rhizophagus irregularis DAOM 181602=DAOM 197198]